MALRIQPPGTFLTSLLLHLLGHFPLHTTGGIRCQCPAHVKPSLYLRALPNHLHPLFFILLNCTPVPSPLQIPDIPRLRRRLSPLCHTILCHLWGSLFFRKAFCSHDCSHCALPESRDCPALTDPALSDAPYTLRGCSVTK